MIIEEADFKLEQVGDSNLFNLYLLQVINAKNEEKRREELQQAGYGFSIHSAIKKIINHRINKRVSVTDLKTYFKLYVEESNRLTSLLEWKKST